jgi:hypothetical protein
MTMLPDSNTALEKMMEVLTQLVETEVTTTILKELAPHLKNREVLFEESMGSVTFQVKLRDGRKLYITNDDYWVQKVAGKPTWEPRWMHRWGWVQKAQSLIKSYEDLSNKTSTCIHIELAL